MPDFPSELVEAAAVLLDGMTCERCDGEGYIEIHDPNAAHADNPDGSHDEYCPDCCASGRAGFRKAAALIEQRVIDRLAREAGENPYSRRGAWSPISFVAWRDGAACGVAAERARKLSDDALERAVAHYDEWCGYGAARRGALAAAIAAALSSPAEPGTGEDA